MLLKIWKNCYTMRHDQKTPSTSSCQSSGPWHHYYMVTWCDAIMTSCLHDHAFVEDHLDIIIPAWHNDVDMLRNRQETTSPSKVIMTSYQNNHGLLDFMTSWHHSPCRGSSGPWCPRTTCPRTFPSGGTKFIRKFFIENWKELTSQKSCFKCDWWR